jgi:hypothetical protein
MLAKSRSAGYTILMINTQVKQFGLILRTLQIQRPMHDNNITTLQQHNITATQHYTITTTQHYSITTIQQRVYSGAWWTVHLFEERWHV